MPHDDLVIGIDGGGSKTVAWIAPRDLPNEHNVIGRGQTAGSNVRIAGFEAAQQNIEAAIDLAFEDAGLKPNLVAAVCMGIAGTDRDDERLPMTQWANNCGFAKQVTVTNDAIPLIYAGSRDGCGIAVIAGTGSIALGRDRAGTIVRCGGWGPLFGDEGSGYALVLAALRCIARAADGRGAMTDLTDRFLQAFDITTTNDLIPAVYSTTVNRRDLSALAKLVFSAAEAGDIEAEAILTDGAESLAQMIATVYQKLDFANQAVAIAATGGVLLGQQRYQMLLQDALQKKDVEISTFSLVQHAVAGALQIAAGT